MNVTLINVISTLVLIVLTVMCFTIGGISNYILSMFSSAGAGFVIGLELMRDK